MNDLLITSMSGIVLYQDGKTHMVAHGTYYGLTWSKNYIYSSFNPQHRNVTEIEVFDTNFFKVGQLNTEGLQGVHQIFFWDKELHVVNTSRDSVYVYAGDEVCHFNWTGDKEDKHHINSLWIDNSYIFAVEGMTKHLKGVPSVQVLTHNYKRVKKHLLPAALQLHNVYVENGTLYSLGKFGLVKKSLEEKRYQVIDLRQDLPNGFLRGFARSRDNFYIGESAILPRDERVYGDSDILVLDNEYRIIDTIKLKDTGQIHDIRIVNGPDLAHNGVVLNYQRPKEKEGEIKLK